MQAIIEIGNEESSINSFTKAGGISILERQIHILTRMDVIKIFIVSKNSIAIEKIIKKRNFQADFEILNSFEQALEKSFMNSFVIKENAVFEPDFLSIPDKDSAYTYGNLAVYYIPYKILKNIKLSSDIGKISYNKINSEKFHLSVKDKNDKKNAEKKLVKMLLLPHEDFVARTFNIPISQFITKRIMHFPITPNMITFFVFLLGIASVIPLFLPLGYWKEAIAGALFHLRSVIDGCDGEIARLKFQTSKKGAILDQLVDESTNIIFITAMTYYAYINFYPSNVFVFTIVFLVPVLFISGKMMEIFVNVSSGFSESDKSRKFNFETKTGKTFSSVFFEIIRQIGRNSFVALLIFISGLISIFKYAPYIAPVMAGGIFLSFFVQFIVQLRELSKIKKSYKNVKACLFDFDGTLVDDMQDFADLAAETMGKYYGTSFKLARKRYIDITGIPFIHQIHAIFPGAEKNEEANEYFESNKEPIFFQKHIEPEVKETLQWLKKHNKKIAVSSGGFKEMMVEFCKRDGVEFDLIMGYEKGFEKGPQHFDYMLKEFNITKDEMLFCGDSLKDAEKGLDFGIHFIARSGTFSEKAFKQNFKGIKVIHHFKELKHILH